MNAAAVGDKLISSPFQKHNKWSWNTVEVYASAELLADITTKIKEAYPNSKPTAKELLMELYKKYNHEGVFPSYALGFNNGNPYLINCSVSVRKEDVPLSMPVEELRALCQIRVRLTLPVSCPDLQYGGLFL